MIMIMIMIIIMIIIFLIIIIREPREVIAGTTYRLQLRFYAFLHNQLPFSLKRLKKDSQSKVGYLYHDVRNAFEGHFARVCSIRAAAQHSLPCHLGNCG